MGLTDGFGSILDRDGRLEQTDRQTDIFNSIHYAMHSIAREKIFTGLLPF